MNKYSYCANNPTSRVDPSGHHDSKATTGPSDVDAHVAFEQDFMIMTGGIPGDSWWQRGITLLFMLFGGVGGHSLVTRDDDLHISGDVSVMHDEEGGTGICVSIKSSDPQQLYNVSVEYTTITGSQESGVITEKLNLTDVYEDTSYYTIQAPYRNYPFQYPDSSILAPPGYFLPNPRIPNFDDPRLTSMTIVITPICRGSSDPSAGPTYSSPESIRIKIK